MKQKKLVSLAWLERLAILLPRSIKRRQGNEFVVRNWLKKTIWLSMSVVLPPYEKRQSPPSAAAAAASPVGPFTHE